MTAKTLRRSAALLAALTLCLLVAAAAGSAHPATTGSETITLYFLDMPGASEPAFVVARGPLSGVGTETQLDKRSRGGEINYVTLHFDKGTLRFVAREQAGWKPNLATCRARGYGGGTWKISGGSGAYQGASGTGSFRDGGISLAQRTTSGKCLGSNTAPANHIDYTTITLRATITLPSA